MIDLTIKPVLSTKGISTMLISYLWTCDEYKLYNCKYRMFLTLVIENLMKDPGSRSEESRVLTFDREHGVPTSESLAHEDN